MLTQLEIERRRGYITATDVPAIIGVNPYRNAHDVYLDKITPLDWKGNDATDAGNLLEPVILKWAESQLGPIRDGEFRVHAEGLLACTLDGEVVSTGEPVEAKSHGIVGPTDWSAWGQAGTDEIPDSYAIQVQTQLLVTGQKMAWVPALIGGRGFAMFEVAAHAAIQEMILGVAIKFWRDHVLNRIPPDCTPHLDVLKRMKREPGKSVPISDHVAREYIEASKAKSAAVARHEAAQEALLAALGDGDGATWAGGMFTYFEQFRKGYTVEPTTFRVLRHKADKGGELAPEDRHEFTTAQLTELADERLASLGYLLKDKSASGSRYYCGLNLPDVRLADHEPNTATANWMTRNGVLGIRLDHHDVPGQLNQLAGIVNGYKKITIAKGVSA